jgi:hypothetical protein
MQDLIKTLRLSAIPVVIASLCCLSPVILVSLGLSTAAFGASLADSFYGEYKWYFRIAGIAALALALTRYFRSQKGICTLDEAVKRRNEIINAVALTALVGVIGYLFFLYVVVHYAGIFLNIWA